MVKFQGKERRNTHRTALNTACVSDFTYKNKPHAAIMVDVSDNGAKFSIEKPSDHVELILGDELSINVNTPYGVSLCKGTIVWSRHSDEYYTWGIKFTDLSPDTRDPLRCLIDSPF